MFEFVTNMTLNFQKSTFARNEDGRGGVTMVGGNPPFFPVDKKQIETYSIHLAATGLEESILYILATPTILLQLHTCTFTFHYNHYHVGFKEEA